jgi:pantothenate kinase
VQPLLERARALAARPGRALLGITGAPGAGKSTLAAWLVSEVEGAALVPMDGFHRTTADLAARGWVAERGTPRTFDADGYLALLHALRAGGPVRAPTFDREREEPVPEAVLVASDTQLVITEGNYLLLNQDPWVHIQELLDEVWFVEVPERLRVERLVARHVRYGRDPAAAWERATSGSDAANARLVAATRSRADLVVDAAEFSL